MSSVFIPGGASYIASYFVDLLNNNNHQFKIYDNLLYFNDFMKPVPFVNGDIRDTDRLVEEASRYDKVVFFAGLVGESGCNVNINITKEVNYLAVKRFCEKLPKSIPICFLSTCSVFGKNNSLLNEESHVNPLGPYAHFKYLAEQPVLDRGNSIVVRMGTIFGLGGLWGRVRGDLCVNAMTYRAWKYKQLNVTGADQKRPIIAAKDAAEYLYEWATTDKKPGIYIFSSENVNIKDLGERVAKCVPGTEIIYNDIKFEDERNYHVDTTKAKNNFSFRPWRTVEGEVENLLRVLNDGRIKDFENRIYNNGAFLNFQNTRNEFK